MGFEWSTEQKAVIETKGRDLLVSAAAGSGKTAVLVERIIRMITDEENPVPAEKLLVLTFTKAAAAEMKDRISKGIDRCLEADPANNYLHRQKEGLHFAQISTIHSLCMNLIREHLPMLDMDPSFAVGDETELKLIKQETAEDVLEVFYASGSQAFRDFSDAYGSGKLDWGLDEMILKVYEAAQGQPSPKMWLNQVKHWYETDGDCPAIRRIEAEAVSRTAEACEACSQMLMQGIRLLEGVSALEPIVPVLKSDLSLVRKLAGTSEWEAVKGLLDNPGWMRMPSIRKLSEPDKALKERITAIRKAAKETLGGLKSDYYSHTPEDIAGQMDYLRPYIDVLISLVEVFTDQYTQKKRERHLIDFADQEHLALEILADFSQTPEGDVICTPTRAALMQQDYYAEVICDEYQDTNPVQEMILQMLAASARGRHDRFMVGDVKQSIYRFRLADAAIFMNKYDTYTPSVRAGEDDMSVRIDLHRNFRSREIILDSANYMFRQLMRRERGGIAYDDDAALAPGRNFPDAGDLKVSDRTEVILVDYDEELIENNDLIITAKELEAAAIAAKIRQLTDPEKGLYVLDDETGSYRIAGYDDIVILMRTMSGWAREVANVLMQENIPVSVEISEGFFSATEIQTMVSLLQVIDNPDQDIPLAAVLLSPVCGFSEEELTVLKTNAPEGSLYKAVRAGAEEGSDKCCVFISMLSDLRTVSRYMAVDELLLYIYEKTGYYDDVQVLPFGERRRANLDALIARAAVYASGSMTGLFNFVRYIEQMKERKMDFGEAAVGDGARGCVRLISIHKSKGLEYPVVILAGLGKQFNMQDAQGAMVLHPQYGIGLDAFNPENRRKMGTAYKQFIAESLKQETLAEELRILYVAMTRAKEHLVMTGITSKAPEKLEDASRIGGTAADPMPVYRIRGGKSFMDWILMCIGRDEASQELFSVHTFTPEHVIMRQADEAARRRFDRQALESVLSEKDGRDMDELLTRLASDAGWVYPWQEAAGKKEKYSVSELKKADVDEAAAKVSYDAGEKPDPEIMRRAAFRGTAFHRVMELLDFKAAPENPDRSWVASAMDDMCRSGKLTQEQAEAVSSMDVVRLMESPLGQRMKAADIRGKLMREVPFMAGVPASFIDEGPRLMADHEDEDLVIIQGVIDACFEENGRMVIVDYKTDAVGKDEGEAVLTKRYKKQLDYYAFALSKMTHLSADERRIYSTRMQRDFAVS